MNATGTQHAATVAAVLPTPTPEFAQRIGERARRRLLSEHTYHHRAQELKKLLAEQIAASRMSAHDSKEIHRAAIG